MRLLCSLLLIILVSSDCTTQPVAHTSSSEELTSGSVTLDGSVLEFLTDSQTGQTQSVGLRFDNVFLDSDEDVHINFLVDSIEPSTSLNIVISAELSGSPSSFTNTDFDLSSRTRTNTEVLWNVDSGNAVIDTPSLAYIVDEVASVGGYSGSIVFIFTLLSGSGSATLTPVLQLSVCEDTQVQSDCQTLNFCCGSNVDGAYVKSGSRVNGHDVWQHTISDYRIFWEDVSVLDGEIVSDSRWVIGSFTSSSQQLYVSGTPSALSPSVPNLKGSWLVFENALNLFDAEDSLDCALNWEPTCQVCDTTVPEVQVYTMDPTMHPSYMPNLNPSDSPTYSPTKMPSSDSACSLKLGINICDNVNANTQTPFEIEVCSGEHCRVYQTGLDSLSSGDSFSLHYNEDEWLQSADSIQIVAQSEDATCLSLTTTHNFESLNTPNTWLDTNCETSSERCPCNYYPIDGLVYSCGKNLGVLHYSLGFREERFLTTVPVGTQSFSVTITADSDCDLKLYTGTRDNLGDCLIGYGCLYYSKDQTIFYHEGMPIVFSGDQRENPVRESVLIPDTVTTPITFQVKSYRLADIEITYGWEAVTPCDLSASRCVECQEVADCDGNLIPHCNGSSEIECVEESEADALTCDEYGSSESCTDVIQVDIPKCDPDATPPVIVTTTEIPTPLPTPQPTPTPTSLEQAYAELLELYTVTEFLYETLKVQSTVYTGALVDGPVVLQDDSLTLVTEFTDFTGLVASGGQLFVPTLGGQFLRTCVGYSTIEGTLCDSTQLVCGGGNTVGTQQEIETLLNQLREQDSMHPSCPTGCQSVSTADADVLGIDNLCTYRNEYYFIGDDGTKMWSCVATGESSQRCPSNQIACGGCYVGGLPTFGDLHDHASLLSIADENEHKRYSYCPSYTAGN